MNERMRAKGERERGREGERERGREGERERGREGERERGRDTHTKSFIYDEFISKSIM